MTHHQPEVEPPDLGEVSALLPKGHALGNKTIEHCIYLLNPINCIELSLLEFSYWLLPVLQRNFPDEQ